ncbi:hypothetical protein SIAM614_00522 [Stappia aggregata IAM 12614]|uniref:Uncharacterized protein n=1 Tax=Roseibium aggregatum (strain ATCC 25650 / DSM 13394 / JCM 20685 / NBRC 16684 / NCIMB 2208 / IAM 12614 / B1) TaxID=384765 RepID=A0P2M7_ROSAI|nr:hypothetical protein SIAM614_00522 [Stappia aggregata IAM 12614] [Roseibium aggregatum IAM 12614]
MDMQIAWDLQEFTKDSKKQNELDKIEPIDMENAVAA